MPANNRAELLAMTDKEYTKLMQQLEDLDLEHALAKDEDDTNIKDVVAHRAHWIDLFMGWYGAGLAGKEVAFPAPGYKWNELKRYNADLRSRQTGLGWVGAREQLADAHGRLRGFIEGHTDEELYGGPMVGANNAWTPGRWAEAAGSSHYRSAAKYVRGRLKAI